MPSKQVEFAGAGVTVIIPARLKNAKVRKLPKGSLETLRSLESDFSPGRLVINLEIYSDDAADQAATEFDPPVEVCVRYTKADLRRAKKAGKPLELGFWNGSRWVRFTKEKHKFKLRPDDSPESGGVGVVKIKSWGDPPIGWGP